MFCSTIIPTINRPTLSRAVCNVLDQQFNRAGFEVIVVNDSGQPLPDMDWQHSEQVQVLNTNHRERSVARNTGAAIAQGKYLHFLDDDDALLPGALAAFWSLHEAVGVDWLYGSYQTVDNDGRLIEEIHPGLTGNIFALLVAGEGIPLQASLINTRKFHAVGCFDPNLSACEDRDLGRRVALTSSVAHTEAVVASIRIGRQGSTTNWESLADEDRKGREKALGRKEANSRLSASAMSSYVRGRVCRAYFASAVWNMKRQNVLVGTSRALAGVRLVSWFPLSSGFWRGLRTRINQAAERINVS